MTEERRKIVFKKIDLFPEDLFNYRTTKKCRWKYDSRGSERNNHISNRAIMGVRIQKRAL